jgi:hypothetical protein
LAVKTDAGLAKGETRNITGEGFFLYCSERLREGVSYPVIIALPEKRVTMIGKVTWSNLDSCTSLNFTPAMGFYFMRIDEDKDKQILREAIVIQVNKPLRLRQEAEGPAASLSSSEAKSTVRPSGPQPEYPGASELKTSSSR